MSESLLLEEVVAAAETVVEPVAEPVVADEVTPPLPSPDQRASMLAAIQNARVLPPGVRERLQGLVEKAVTLDVAGEPLLATRQVLDLLADGLPAVLRREAAAEIERPQHPDGDAFFAVSSEDLSDQQAEQIARQQLQRAGMLRP